ncbi:MAG TPA: sterol desaturase family protein [Acidimicrobiales bacterium]|nr:sterol desaturase family protein [Acidimicrobiales bacterium]
MATGDNARVNAPADSFTLWRAARAFFGHGSPRLITLALAASLAGRLYVGGWSWWDLVGPGVVLAAQPFTEWLIHVFVLHFRPRTVGRLRIDPLVSRKHRAHHADPRHEVLVFIPLPVVAGLVGALSAICLGGLPLERGLTTLVAAMGVLFTYEWTHFLIHSTYRPRHALYRYVWRAHRNHHFRNEHYWFGVTVHVADHLLGTFPERNAVPVSPTARTLGVRQAA